MVGTHKAAFVLAGVLGLATVLLGGGGATRIASSASPAASPPRSLLPAPQMRVRTGSPLPNGCTTDEAVGIVTAFIDAFNRGDQAALARAFSAQAARRWFVEPGKFQWYSIGSGPGNPIAGFVAWTREELLPDLAERHARHERFRLLQIEVAGSWHPGVDVVYDIERRADDVPVHVAGGKGALDCENRTIFVWSMGDAEVLPDFVHPPPTPTCPGGRPRCQ